MSARALDRHDIALLAKLSDVRFEFAKGATMERRLFDLTQRGYAAREWMLYSQNAGRGTVQMRWAYKRTTQGKAAAS